MLSSFSRVNMLSFPQLPLWLSDGTNLPVWRLEMNLFNEYQTASIERKYQIEADLTEQHKGLAYHVAKRFFNLFGPDDAEDIRQEAMIALLPQACL